MGVTYVSFLLLYRFIAVYGEFIIVTISHVVCFLFLATRGADRTYRDKAIHTTMVILGYTWKMMHLLANNNIVADNPA